MKNIALLTFLSLITYVLSAEQCDTYRHPTYGQGKCVNTNRCPYNLIVSNLCTGFGQTKTVECCFSSPSEDCSKFRHETFGYGKCVRTTECQGANQYALAGYCDSLSNQYTCCFDKPAVSPTGLRSCSMDISKGKGVCVSAANCPYNYYLSQSECNSNEVCCYSLQNNINYYEFRGVWISTVANIDWPSKRTLTTAQQQQELITLLDTIKSAGLNTVVFQVRPAGDAFYSSSLEPWSHYLTGTQGKAPSPLWDPLAFALQEAHKRGLSLHAWINPYRARNKGDTMAFASNHMAVKYSRYAYDYNGYIWMDPGSSEVRSYIIKVIEDIVTRYNVDGIHMDDYFYPYPQANVDFPDSATYNAYRSSGGTLSKADWRRDNVNRMVNEIYAKIKSIKKHVQYGISPFGIWRPGYPAGIQGLDSYEAIYADSRKWLQSGWLDYFAPQLYWEIDPPAQSFRNLLKWWCEQNTQKKLIVPGLALYKMQDNNWPASEISRQVDITREFRNIGSYGAIHFTANHLTRNVKGIKDVLTNKYSSPALTPAMNTN